jgi:cytidylate kinase
MAQGLPRKGRVKMPVITFSGALGSGTREIARLVASRLGLEYVDREILARTAQSLGVSVAAVEQRDERPATLGERVAFMLTNFLERSAVAGGDPMLGPESLAVLLSRTYTQAISERPDGPAELDEHRYIRTITGVIETLAKGGGAVLVGRGSPVILRDWPGSLHVLTMAPFEMRVRRVALREEMTVEEARHRVQESDHGRAAFHRKFFKVDADDPSLFDIVINTARLSYEVGAEVTVTAARSLEASPV